MGGSILVEEGYGMFGRKKKKQQVEEPMAAPQPEEKPTPAYLRDDYPYKAIGDPITDLDTIADSSEVYEIKCHECEMSIRSQGPNIKSTYERLMAGNGCLGCGNKDLVVRLVDMSAARKKMAETESEAAPAAGE